MNKPQKFNVKYFVVSILMVLVLLTPIVLYLTGAWFTARSNLDTETSLQFGSVGLGDNFRAMKLTNLVPTQEIYYHGSANDNAEYADLDDIEYAGSVDAYYRIGFDIKLTNNTEDAYSETLEKLLDFNTLDASQVRDDWHIYGKVLAGDEIPKGKIRLSSETPNLLASGESARQFKIEVTIDMIQSANLGGIEGVDYDYLDSDDPDDDADKLLCFQNLFYFKDWGTTTDTTGLTYTLNADGNSYWVSGIDTENTNLTTTLKIPQTYNGKKVIGIGKTSTTSTPTANASIFPNTITNVIMSPYVEDIGDYVFYNQQLRNIESSSNLITIGKQAFAENSNYLKKVNIPSSVTHIGADAFYRVRELLSLKLPPNATIGVNSFQRCGRFPYAVFGEDSQLTSCPNFYEGSLKCLILPNTITSFSSGEIAGNNGLETLMIRDGGVYYSKNNCIIKSDGDVLVAHCKTSVIPAEVKTIDRGTFTYGLTTNEIIIPHNVNTLKSVAFEMICFSGITGDKILTILNPNITIENGCVNNNKLTTINYNGTVAQFTARGWAKSVFTNGSQDIDVVCTDGNYNGYKSA